MDTFENNSRPPNISESDKKPFASFGKFTDFLKPHIHENPEDLEKKWEAYLGSAGNLFVSWLHEIPDTDIQDFSDVCIADKNLQLTNEVYQTLVNDHIQSFELRRTLIRSHPLNNMGTDSPVFQDLIFMYKNPFATALAFKFELKMREKYFPYDIETLEKPEKTIFDIICQFVPTGKNSPPFSDVLNSALIAANCGHTNLTVEQLQRAIITLKEEEQSQKKKTALNIIHKHSIIGSALWLKTEIYREKNPDLQMIYENFYLALTYSASPNLSISILTSQLDLLYLDSNFFDQSPQEF
jgi:hypothetical protein